MTFDFQRALGFALSARNFRPSPLPVGGGFPPTWYAPGWSTGFLNPANDVDPDHSYGYYAEPGWESSPGAGDGRSYVEPSRTKGSNLGFEYFTNGLPNGWTYIATGTGTLGLTWLPDPDPVIMGNALDMKTNGTVGSLAGICRTISTLPGTYGWMALPQLTNVGPNPLDALQILTQNNAGKTLMIRLYDNQVDVSMNGGWQPLYTGRGGNYIWEVWVMQLDNSDGTHTVKLYSGTEEKASLTGVLPSGTAFANNSVTIVQRSGTNPWRRSYLRMIMVGTTQLADTMELVCKPFEATFSPEVGHVVVMVEDVSKDITINGNVEMFVTKNNVTDWQKVTLEEVALPNVPGIDLPVWGRGEIGNLKPIRMYVGSIEFMPGSGQTMRWNYKTSGGTFAATHGVTFFWDELG